MGARSAGGRRVTIAAPAPPNLDVSGLWASEGTSRAPAADGSTTAGGRLSRTSRSAGQVRAQRVHDLGQQAAEVLVRRVRGGQRVVGVEGRAAPRPRRGGCRAPAAASLSVAIHAVSRSSSSSPPLERPLHHVERGQPRSSSSSRQDLVPASRSASSAYAGGNSRRTAGRRSTSELLAQLDDEVAHQQLLVRPQARPRSAPAPSGVPGPGRTRPLRPQSCCIVAHRPCSWSRNTSSSAFSRVPLRHDGLALVVDLEHQLLGLLLAGSRTASGTRTSRRTSG